MTQISNYRRGMRIGRMALIATGLLPLLSPVAWAAGNGVSAAAAERMVAASPQRERHREWNTCINNVAGLIIAQSNDMQKIRDMMGFVCGNEESRLTGSLIAKYGNAQGNGAMQALKRSALARFQSQITQKTQRSNDRNFIETVAGWDVNRTNGGCMASWIEPGTMSIGQVATMVFRGKEGDFIIFLLIGSANEPVDKKITKPFIASYNFTSSNVDINLKQPLELTPSLDGDRMLYVAKATDELIAQLAGAKKIQLFIPTDWGAGEWPASFPLSSVDQAWSAVKRCTAR